MTIVAADLVFIASEQMNDNTSTALGTGGGGRMGFTIVQDGTENNVFPDVMPSERTAGAMTFRKAYGACLSNNNEGVSFARVGLAAPPTDPNVSVVLVGSSGDNELLAEVKAAVFARPLALIAADMVQTRAFAPAPAGGSIYAGATAPEFAGLPGQVLGASVISIDLAANASGAFEPGNKISGHMVRPIGGFVISVFTPSNFQVSTFDLVTILSTVVAGSFLHITIDFTLPIGAVEFGTVYIQEAARSPNSGRVVSHRATTGALSASATSATLSTLVAPAPPGGIAQIAFFRGDTVVFQHPTVAATREERVILSVNHTTNAITFDALTNAYPSGSFAFVPVPLGPLQASLSLAPFSVQAWPRRFTESSDSAMNARYSGTVGLNNQGAVTDRYAIVFTSATHFNLVSERRGQIASGDTTADFSPLNPLTNQPLFTLYWTGWGQGGFIPGNAVRFNTRAAAAPFWAVRIVQPSTAGGTDQATLFLDGEINA